jgi:hypothetical protein
MEVYNSVASNESSCLIGLSNLLNALTVSSLILPSRISFNMFANTIDVSMEAEGREDLSNYLDLAA